ncbi:hypothetical protein KBA63_01840 [Candidatus Woesebacteria bacterium]|nr:hypothetical protein [Candidatus Woesebacteria bacterium]MBP9687460.1 hypothetical protein [Candidatus Woesebacteria bacterium]
MKQVIEPIPGSKMNRFWRFLLGKVIPSDGIITSCDLKSQEIKWLWSHVGYVIFWLLFFAEFFYLSVIQNVLGSRYTFLGTIAFFLLFTAFYEHKITVAFRKVVSKVFNRGFWLGEHFIPWAAIALFSVCILTAVVYVRDVIETKTLFLPSMGIGISMVAILICIGLYVLFYGFYRITKEIFLATIGQQEVVYVIRDGKTIPLPFPKYMAWAIKLKLCKIYDFRK